MAGDSGAKAARRAREAEESRELRVKTGSQDIRKMFDDTFNQDYMNYVRDSTTAFYKPQLKTQYDQATRQLQAALMRAGINNSSAGNMKREELEKVNIDRTEDINQKAIGVQQNRRQDLLAAEGQVLAQLQNSGDVGAANSQAASQISANYKPPAFSPLGAVFTDVTAGLATQADMERQGTNRYNVGVTNWGNNLRRYSTNVR